MTLEELNTQIKQCQRCRLWKGAKNAVPGQGPPSAKIFLVGQNPGAEEDKSGRPFVGRAGKFLNKVLSENQIERSDVFVTNIVKHLTPENRAPYEDEVKACAPYLDEQIELVKPQIVVLMGKVAEQYPRLSNVEYIVTVHPSAAMRFSKMKKRFTEDFAKLKERI